MATDTAQLTRPRLYPVPRAVHPVAWWVWAIGLAVAASRTTNPLLLGILVGVAACVVLSRRGDAPWAMAFRIYLLFGALVIAIRVVFRVLFGGGQGETVLVPLPALELPGLTAGVTLLGDLTAQSLLAGFYDGARLATMVVCLGAANCLANPRRLLRTMPPALHAVSTALVVAISVFPQLAESFVRIRAAGRLRPNPDRGRIARLRAVVIPLLEDALERSMLLAASMDSRGYGRSGPRSRSTDRWVGGLMVGGLVGLCVGVYALLDATTPRLLAGPMLLGGALVGLTGIWLSGRGVVRTSYRPDRWGLPELVTVGCGVAAAVVMLTTSSQVLHPSLVPLGWPALPVGSLLGLLVALLPAFLTPTPPPVEGGAR